MVMQDHKINYWMTILPQIFALIHQTHRNWRLPSLKLIRGNTVNCMTKLLITLEELLRSRMQRISNTFNRKAKKRVIMNVIDKAFEAW